MVQPQYSPISKQGTNPSKFAFSRSTTVILIIFLLCLIGFYAFHASSSQSSNLNLQRSLPNFPDSFLSLSSNSTVSHYLRSLTLHPHLAGSDQARQTALFVKTHFENLGLTTKSSEFRVLLSYPVKSSLSAQSTHLGNHEFGLSDSGRVTIPYHAYSPSGSAKGKAVFVNYGREEDYKVLKEIGIDVTGCVAVARRGGGVSRGGVARIAAEKGVLAVLTYVEGEEFKKGVERGTVMKGIGDPLSPGWASEIDGERLERSDGTVKGRFPVIPSTAISSEMAEFIVKSLDGGKLPLEWGIQGFESAGPGPTLLNFSYQGEERMANIQDIFAVIEGYEEPDRYVLLGNHRDAWTYGAVDPNSGTAALLDIARRLAFLMKLGWKPRRTIVLCSWDAEEFGMIGSTEWVEQNLVNLGSKAVAYLNVDCAAQGPGFFARATLQLDDLIVDVTKRVKDPEAAGRTVYDQWTSANSGISIERLGEVDSDFAPFVQHAGVPSIDMYYGKDFPVYHTAFDSYEWMVTYGDPSFHRHVAVAELWGLLALRLADDPILPFNYLPYTNQLQDYASILSRVVEGVEGRISIDPITQAIQHLSDASRKVNDEVKKLHAAGEASADHQPLQRRMLNDRLMLAERALLDADGIQTMEWFKHLVYGPSGVEGEHNLPAFPSIVNAIYRSEKPMKASDRYMIQHQVWRVSRAIKRAADALNGLVH